MLAPSPLLRIVTLVVCVFASSAIPAVAQEKPGWKPISKEEQAIAEAMMKSMMPGEPHRLLASLAGEWTVAAKMWLDPTKPPEESAGTATNTTIMGGRYLQGTFKGHMMGMPFEGLGITAHDNVTGEYQSVWLDNMGTMLMYATGSYDPTTKTLMMRSEISDVVDPKVRVPIREALTILDANTHRMEMFETRDGRERKTLEITYTRKR